MVGGGGSRLAMGMSPSDIPKQGEGYGQRMVETQLVIEAYYIGSVYIVINPCVSA
jgi:hypothetical protein